MKRTIEKAIIGVDVGGTKIRAGAITPEGKIIGEPVTVSTDGNDESEKIFSRIAGAIETVIGKTVLSGRDIIGIGMGVTGPLDSKKGIILECPQLPTMHFYPLGQRIKEKFQLPVVMDNDANALLLGESIWGAGKGYRTTLGFTLGTGLGCALVKDNELFTGAHGLAGEIWPSPYKGGSIEDIVSGRGVSAIYHQLTNQWNSAEEIARFAHDDDDDAIETWNIFGCTLAIALAWGINFTDPDIVILGGSIANSFDLFCDPMERLLKKYICPVPAEETHVVKAALGDNAGFIGAAALMIGENKEHRI